MILHRSLPLRCRYRKVKSIVPPRGLPSSEELTPPWNLVLSYEHAIRKHTYKVTATAGYSFGAALVHAYNPKAPVSLFLSFSLTSPSLTAPVAAGEAYHKLSY